MAKEKVVTLLEIKYKNTLDDYVKFTYFLEKPLAIIIFYGFQIWFLICIVYAIKLDHYSLTARMIVVVEFIFLWFIFCTFYNRVDKKLVLKRMKRKIKKDQTLLSERTLIINENNIIVKSTKEVKEFSFEVVYKIQEEYNCIYIISNKHKCIAIIPTDIFTSTEEKEEIITQLKTRNKRK